MFKILWALCVLFFAIVLPNTALAGRQNIQNISIKSSLDAPRRSKHEKTMGTSNARRRPVVDSSTQRLSEFSYGYQESESSVSGNLNVSAVEMLKRTFQRAELNVNINEVVAGYDEVNGGTFSEPSIHEKRNLQATNYACTGVCCSSAGVTYKYTKTMLSRWLTNAMYNNAKVHIWTWERNSYWGPSNKNNANWGGNIIANRNQSQKSAANSITIIRRSATTIRLLVPGGGYIEALSTGNIQVNKNPGSGSTFTFIRVGTGHVRFKTIFNTYVVLGGNRKLYHWTAAIPGPWQTFLIYEVKAVPSFRGVNLGAWLFPENWMTPSLWDNVPKLIDGYEFQMQSLRTRKWVVTTNGNTLVSASVGLASQADQFVLRREVTARGKVLIRNKNSGRYLTAINGGGQEFGTNSTLYPGRNEKFTMHSNPGTYQIMLQAPNGKFLRVSGTRLLLDVNPATINLASQTTWRTSSTVFTLSTLKVWRTQYQMCIGLGRSACTKRMRRHWSTFITEPDWKWIRDKGLNAVRLPIGYWLAQGTRPDYPFPTGGYYYLDWAFKMAVKYQVRIFISMHSAPSSNNNLETRDGFYEFTNIPGTYTKMVNCVAWVAKRYGSNPMFAGINVINEPYNPIPQDLLVKYYKQTVAQVRKYSKCAYVSYNIRYGSDPLGIFQYPEFPTQATNIIQDQHQYKVFNAEYSGKTTAQIVQEVTVGDASWLKYIEAGDRYMAMVGEFSNSLPITPAKESEYKPYADAQMKTYGTHAEAGWFFWNYKVRAPYYGGWSFRYGVDNKYIVKQFGWAW